jgi:hypothetical protein
MSHPIATYSFLPWMRQGLSNQIGQADGDGSIKTRATIDVKLNLRSSPIGGGADLISPINKPVELFGPGDIVGIEQRAIIKTEPRDWITNFEPNYLPYIDFYDEDFPWRYTPAKPSGHRLRPWITLVVLEESEFEDGKNIQDKPLPFIKVTNFATLFPKASDLWAWAHVHVNRNIVGNETDVQSNDGAAAATRLQAVLKENPDLAYSRIVCPRHLKDNTAYHAFVIPTFETGRLSGLGFKLNKDDGNPKVPSATFSSWGREGYTAEESENFPYYHRWYFRTGTVGDFEYLVRLLKPQPVDGRVGTRDMDVQEPGVNIAGITSTDLEGVLKLGGALRIPYKSMKDSDKEVFDKYDKWAEDTAIAQPFQNDLATFINLADDYSQKAAKAANQAANNLILVEGDDQDPLITPPLYGTWHALTKRLDVNKLPKDQNWVHELNLDPRFRASAGIGTNVVKENQEPYMEAAWEQIGDVLEANRKMRLAQLARQISFVWWNTHLRPLQLKNADKYLAFTAPLHKRIIPSNPKDVLVLSNGQATEKYTVYKHLFNSPIPNAILSTPLRRIIRPGSRIMRQMEWGNTVETSPNTLISRLNEEVIFAAPPKVVPEGVTTTKDVANALKPQSIPSFLVDWLEKYNWLKYIPLALAILLLIIGLIFGFFAIIIPVVIVLIGLFFFLMQKEKEIQQANSVLVENQVPEAVDKLPKSPDFRITPIGDPFRPTLGGNIDSTEGVRFKTALKDVYTIIEASRKAAVQVSPIKVKIPELTGAIAIKINPIQTILQRYFQNILIPSRIKDLMFEEFIEAWAYPKIDLPMYKPLANLSSELFLPNINFIEQNSISLLETNQKFIESYMVGINHEFSRELLWREYPTDQRGSYFRQFWDISSFLSDKNISDDELRENLYDIPKLHLWPKDSQLGSHYNREVNGKKEDEVVLVVRGELLKKYPTAVIYAHKADWAYKKDINGNFILDSNGKKQIDLANPRVFMGIDPTIENNPPRTIIKTPLYEAKVEPDIYFFGFDITVCKAKGGTGKLDEAVDADCALEGVTRDDAGWFFVIKERPGEPRFGLDIEGDTLDKLYTWNDLAWKDVPTDSAGNIDIATITELKVKTPPAAEPEAEKAQHREDNQIILNNSSNAADLAYILYQVPVLVGVHASEMLPKDS